MRFVRVIDAYIEDQRIEGRINSPNSERDYRSTLEKHAEDVGDRDPDHTNRDDVKKTLKRWPNPNTRSKNRAIMVSFYRWMVEEGKRPSNPAEATKRPRRKKPQRYRLTQDETVRMLQAAQGQRECRLIYLAVCAGLRRQELRGMQGKHFRRPGWVWVDASIGKGKKERWIPVIKDLELVWAEISEHTADDEYVLPAQRFRDPGLNKTRHDYNLSPASFQALWRLNKRVTARAGLPVDAIGLHTLRHAFCDHIARHAGLQVAQAAMGHSNLSTTELYLSQPSLDEIAQAMRGVSLTDERVFDHLEKGSAKPEKAPTGLEPVPAFSRVLERLWLNPGIRQAAQSMA